MGLSCEGLLVDRGEKPPAPFCDLIGSGMTGTLQSIEGHHRELHRKIVTVVMIDHHDGVDPALVKTKSHNRHCLGVDLSVYLDIFYNELR